MKRMRCLAVALLALPIVWVNCAGAAASDTGDDAAGMAPPATRSWEDWMAEVIDPGYHDVFVDEAGKDPDDMDLTKIEHTAREMAPGMALGYGRLERKNVKEFAEIARLTERWLLTIAAEARAGRAAQVRDLIVGGEVKYCDRCHTAVDRAK